MADFIELTALEGEANQVRISVSDSDLVLHCPYHKSAITQIKQIEGAVYQAADKCWYLPVTPHNLTALYDLVLALRELFQREQDKADAREDWRQNIAADVLAQLKADFDHPQIHFSLHGGQIGLEIPYDPVSIRQIKKIEGRRWDAESKCWLIPADQERPLRAFLRQIERQLKS